MISSQLALHVLRHPLISLAQGRIVEVNITVCRACAPMPEQESGDMQAFPIHDRVRGVRVYRTDTRESSSSCPRRTPPVPSSPIHDRHVPEHGIRIDRYTTDIRAQCAVSQDFWSICCYCTSVRTSFPHGGCATVERFAKGSSRCRRRIALFPTPLTGRDEPYFEITSTTVRLRRKIAIANKITAVLRRFFSSTVYMQASARSSVPSAPWAGALTAHIERK